MEREKYIDCLRIISAYSVVLLHSTSYAIYELNGFFQQFVFLNTFTRFAVPIFFMCSGAVILKPGFNIEGLVSRNKRILLPLIFWSCFYEFYLIYCGIHKNFLTILNDILHDKVMYHMWFLYALLGVYLLMPFLYKMIQGMDLKDWKWFWILSILITLFKTIATYNNSSLPASFTIVPICIVYVIAGYYLAHFKFFQLKTVVYIGYCLLSVLIIAMLTISTSNLLGKYTESFIALDSFFIFFGSCNMFLLIKSSSNFLENRYLSYIIEHLSRTTFFVIYHMY